MVELRHDDLPDIRGQLIKTDLIDKGTDICKWQVIPHLNTHPHNYDKTTIENIEYMENLELVKILMG